MHIQIISRSNGVGLSRDIKLLADALSLGGYEPAVTCISEHDRLRRRSVFLRSISGAARMLRHGRPAHYDLNIMLEHAWPHLLSQARANIIVPNPEWFDRLDLQLLPELNAVLAKTRYTQGLFMRLGAHVIYTGFDSEDRYDAGIMRERVFLHLAGRSIHKGTARLLPLWAAHPEWPKLVVVQHDLSSFSRSNNASNIEFRHGLMQDPQLRELQNRCRFHLCLSEVEGWGHYIVEAMSCAALTITLDAPPMNELVQPDRGINIAYEATGRHHQADTFQFDSAALEQTIERIMRTPDAELETIGARARRWFLTNKQDFPARMATALEPLAPTRMQLPAA